VKRQLSHRRNDRVRPIRRHVVPAVAHQNTLALCRQPSKPDLQIINPRPGIGSLVCDAKRIL
jgi:hypothetical protein